MTVASRITRVPHPFEVERGRELAHLYGASGALGDLIAGAAGCSPFLASLLEKERAWCEAALADPEGALDDLLRTTATDLRQGKRRLALLVALCDLGGVWSLDEVTGALTRYADHAVAQSLHAACQPLIAKGTLPAETGLFALAMGKMGARELNYSSDIDLILLFDDATLSRDDALERRGLLIRAARKAMKDLSDMTGDGYVFRTDLRLRPDAAVTPIVLTSSAAEAYYESVGRTWERAAHIKARVAAGDTEAGERYLAALSPFIWRKHLDFAAIEDAHEMLTKIRDHRGLHGPITLPGHDMKLGRGGIREIEFFAQTRQLISGGRDPSLRSRGTRATLMDLARAGWISPDTSTLLDTAYVSHREVEHRLQMLRDAQTHALPLDDAGMARLAAFMGLDAATFKARLKDTLEGVHAATEPFFAPARPSEIEPDFGADVTEGWWHYPALRSDRSQRLFERLKPQIMARLSQGPDPDRALRQFDAFLAGLPAGVQVFSLFDANPQLLDLLAEIASLAPGLAEYLGRNAAVLDAVIGGDFFAPWPGTDALRADLLSRMGVGDYEAQLDALRGAAREWHFRVGVHLLRGLSSAEDAGHQYAQLAEAVLRAVWPAVVQDMTRSHGPPPGLGAAVVAMGSLGAGRLHPASDLDLLLIYDADGQESSEGARPLAARAYYARLTQRLITALSAPMSQGRLYEVDMRLRPSGRNGPLATSITSFDTYQREDAWTWEHLALTRARVVAGPAKLAQRIEAIRCAILKSSPGRAQIAKDVADMRARIFAARPGRGGLEPRNGPGRQQDLELFAQTLARLAGSDAHSVTQQLNAGLAAGLITAQEHAQLSAHAEELWRIRALARLLLKPSEPITEMPELLTRVGNQGMTGRDVTRAAQDADAIITTRLADWSGPDTAGSEDT